METLIDGSPMPPSYIQRQRQAAPVSGRGGQVNGGTDIRTSRVRSIPPAGLGRNVRAARPTGGRIADDFGRAAEAAPVERMPRAERRKIQRANRKAYRRGRR